MIAACACAAGAGADDSVSAARADIAEYLAWYNAHRAHSSLDRSTPDEAYFAGPAASDAGRVR
ncbi:MAG: hypothetical protein B7X79_17290 [Acidovorax sp. 17-64-282]|nr:MAG: hypothetical protein B7Y20_14330 [Acidovorax sp. 16-64-162]OZA54753.1 MAG: hypothetical protein B7X79_17290 [Acidovorax sp. 17-64-282]